MIRHAGLVACKRQGRWRGVLIEGPSGAGKSDLALRALDQGFQLVADDRVRLWTADGRLFGRAPGSLAGLLEVRGQGVLAVPFVGFCEVVLLAQSGDPQRTPDPTTVTILGIPVSRLVVDLLHASAPAKIGRALAAFDAAHKRRI